MSEIDYKSIAKENHRKCTDAYVEILKLEKRIEKLSLENDVLKMDYETLKESYLNSEMNLQHVTEELEQQQQKWIPIRERWPMKSGYYLVTYREWSNGDYLPKFDDTRVKILKYQESIFRLPVCCDKKAEADTHREVIAWQPLPEPYKEGSHE